MQNNQKPVANLTITHLNSHNIEFNASGSYDPDGLIHEYYWKFSDGFNGIYGSNVVHSFSPGNYSVILTITDDKGASDSIEKLFTVEANAPPASNFSMNSDKLTLRIDVNGSPSQDPDGSIVSYEWDFGDSTMGSGVCTNHTYAQAGIYQVTLTVKDEDGLIGRNVSTVDLTPTSKNVPPVCDFTLYTPGTPSLYIGANGTKSYDPDGSIVSYEWDFGDSTTGSGVQTSHTYAQGGTYHVTLRVTDNGGLTSSRTYNVLVSSGTNNAPPHVSLKANTTTGFAQLMVAFDASGSYDQDGSIASYRWDFGDNQTASGATVQHKFYNPGTYNVRLTLTDNGGATNGGSITITVKNNTPPNADFSYNPKSGHPPLTVSFDASSSTDLEGNIASYDWLIEGNHYHGKIIQHTFNTVGNPGGIPVKLTVTDTGGLWSAITYYVYVS